MRSRGEIMWTKKCLALTFAIFQVFAAFAQSQSTNDEDDELLNVSQSSESEYINLSGQVMIYCYLWVDANGWRAEVDIKARTAPLLVARIQETCNNPSGYTIKFASAYYGNFASGVDRIPYTFTYEGVESSLSSPVTRTRSGPRFDDVTNTSQDFYITVPYRTNVTAGAWFDSIVITLSSNN